MTAVGIASSSQIAADAGAEIARLGGNAVDSALAAVLVSMTTEPGVCSLGSGAYLTVWPANDAPVTIDGNVEMPGRGRHQSALGRGTRQAHMAYGGGITTLVGHGSIGTPGALAAIGLAHERYGALPWRELPAPAERWARRGFPLCKASHNYLVHAHDVAYGWQDESRAAIHDDAGQLLNRGDIVLVADLADSLQRLASHGVQDFYQGELARAIAADCERNDGPLSLRDLNEYQPVCRRPLETRLGEWLIATNPPPAVGGTTLTAMLSLLASNTSGKLSDAQMAHLQARVLDHRRAHLDLADDMTTAARELLAACGYDPVTAPSTVHTSAVDGTGLACAVTASSGYGAGVITPGTGIWMNNCLGEIELNRRGLIAGPPGTRLASNMAPSVAHGQNGAVMAIGSPGADRITTALVQTLNNFIYKGMSLQEAVDAPRLHVDVSGETRKLAYEPGIDVSGIDLPCLQHEEHSMYFGGVGAVLKRADGCFDVAADPRRAGGRAVADRESQP